MPSSRGGEQKCIFLFLILLKLLPMKDLSKTVLIFMTLKSIAQPNFPILQTHCWKWVFKSFKTLTLKKKLSNNNFFSNFKSLLTPSATQLPTTFSKWWRSWTKWREDRSCSAGEHAKNRRRRCGDDSTNIVKFTNGWHHVRKRLDPCPLFINFFYRTIKKCVNVCRDKIWQNSG